MDKAVQADLGSSGEEGKSKDRKEEKKTGQDCLSCRVALVLLAEAHVPMTVTLHGKKQLFCVWKKIIFAVKIIL